jgi:predicted phosphate transport protein (TIGR00153 family)
MLNPLLSLFGQSPFAPLHNHMNIAVSCVHLLPSLFEKVKTGDQAAVNEIAENISRQEHLADLAKNEIRNHLPKGLFLPIDKSSLLEILSLQDQIADKAEDIAVLTTLKPLPVLKPFWIPFLDFLTQNRAAVDAAHQLIKELHNLLESSFGGVEAEKVRAMVDHVAFQEHQADLLQRNLLRQFFSSEEGLTLSTFHLWERIFESTASLSNVAEKLAHRLRTTLELK